MDLLEVIKDSFVPLRFIIFSDQKVNNMRSSFVFHKWSVVNWVKIVL